MKNVVRDRFDILMEKASVGDANAQLRLSKCFKRGHLVEKSPELAKYWAFKSIQNGNRSAIGYYNSLVLFGQKHLIDATTTTRNNENVSLSLWQKIKLFPLRLLLVWIPFVIVPIAVMILLYVVVLLLPLVMILFIDDKTIQVICGISFMPWMLVIYAITSVKKGERERGERKSGKLFMLMKKFFSMMSNVGCRVESYIIYKFL